ncbi:hypothetical protein LZQ00_11165 [Sphingobacterium sp. SRCM116780]|uniref:hypothetical protein n=1 Tax=Sphingobacterium sp. SRCM116780 TaxID=2907623 RepID=UPI001F203AB1|nr:hypothetical protein [Sphingobacterium sp. SRCM116780]UIR54837.1 hypothetical protein LZQ00_11165 [Sphingobacterium sp. SRCM116780]
MYTLNKKIKNLIHSLIAIGLIAAVFSSCAKESDAVVSEEQTGTALTVNIAGIEEDMGVPTKLASTGKNTGSSATAPRTMITDKKLISTQDFDALVNVEGPAPKQKALKAAMGSTQTTSAAMATLMPAGIKYRILLYNAAGTTLLRDVLATSGTNPNIQVDGGTQYKWVAVSINSTTTVPTVSSGKILASALANEDVLYASGVVSATAGQNYLNIMLTRKSTRIQVDVDTRGLFGEITLFRSLDLGTGTGTGFQSLMKTADLDILTGNRTNSTAVAITQNVKYITNKDVSTGNHVKTVSLYTVIPTGTVVAANNLTVRPIFDIKMEPNVYHQPTNTNPTSRTYGNSSIYLKVNNTSFTPLDGELYKIGTQMIESAIKVGNISWARADLFYDTRAGQLDRYKFRPDAVSIHWFNNTTNEDVQRRSYWNWKSLTPAGTAGSGDPCALVYPAGLWRMPTRPELALLAAMPSHPYQWPGSTGAYINSVYRYAGVNQTWNTDAGAPATFGDYSDYMTNFMLLFNGYRQSGVLTESRAILDYWKATGGDRNVTTQMRYWSSEESGSTAYAIAQSAVVNYYTRNPPQLGGPISSSDLMSTGPRTVSTFDKNLGFNIRCLRAQPAS